MRDDPRFIAMEQRALKAEKRVAELDAALAEALLAHEEARHGFHHRVKNSLQVMESYLSLARVQRLVVANPDMLEAEAKLIVISGVYRLALSSGSFGAVPLQDLLKTVLQGALALLRGAEQAIVLTACGTPDIPAESAMLIGLAIVEVVQAVLRAGGCPEVHLMADRTGLVLSVMTPGMSVPAALPARLMAGLKAQLAANDEPLNDGDILRWRIALPSA